MTTTPHGQVPEALRLAHIFDSPLPPEWPDMVAAAAELRRQHARIAELEAVGAGGVQALSAAPAGWKLVPVNPTPEMWKAAKSVPDPNPPYPPHYGLAWDAMLAATPTPPAEQQAQPGAVYAELHEPDATTVGLGAVWNRHSMRDFADRTHALRMQAAPKAAPREPFQHRVQPWLSQCFGAEIAADTVERNHRFLEEALELVQSTGCTQSEAHQLVDYVFGRPVGEPAQEVGGVMVTLAALCLANGLDMHNAGEIELARIWTKVEAIRAKQAAKPKHLPLPQAAPQQEAQEPCGWPEDRVRIEKTEKNN
jgi:hypothetical protein